MKRRAYALVILLAAYGCGGSNATPPALPGAAGTAEVRFVDGAPSLEALVNGVPTSICACYLQVDNSTVTSSFDYGTISSFARLSPGSHSLVARDTLGYAVGPFKTAALTTGKRYTLVVVGAYPTYSVLAFEEPSTTGAALSLYEASPTVPSAQFGKFRASGHSGFTPLGRAQLGQVATVTLGAKVSNFGGYVGPASAPLGALTPKQINAFDAHNVLPFHNAARLSLFLFDPKASVVPVFGSLDR